MIFTLIFITGIYSVSDASLLIQDIDPDLTEIKEKLAEVGKKQIDIQAQMTAMEGRLDNLETDAETTTFPPIPRTACPDRWIAYKGSCYYFGNTDVTFTAAENFCKYKGGHLAHVGNEDENTFLKEVILSYNIEKYYWLGVTDVAKEGEWKLTGDDTVATFFGWGSLEPNGGTRQNCVAFSPKQQYRWIDVSCTSLTARCVCEQP